MGGLYEREREARMLLRLWFDHLVEQNLGFLRQGRLVMRSRFGERVSVSHGHVNFKVIV